MPRLIAALLVACAIVSSASAQIIYEPVQYQYGGQTIWYYGGHDPDVFRFADREHALARNGFVFAVGDITSHKTVSWYHPAVYIDELRRADASIYGFTADDARNAAYQNAARYFCKKDILAQGSFDENGALHVAPHLSSERVSGTIEIKPYVRPVSAPNRVFIFPKDLLDKKLGDSPKTVASAQ
jgi:hypothetical protein